MRNELPRFKDKLKVGRHLVSPPLQGSELGRLIKGLLYLHAAKALDIRALGAIEATGANLDAVTHELYRCYKKADS